MCVVCMLTGVPKTLHHSCLFEVFKKTDCAYSQQYSVNKRGDKTVPCGTLLLIKIMSDCLLSSLTYYG